MKKFIFAAIGMSALLISSCRKDIDADVQKSGAGTLAVLDTLRGVISSNRTVSSDAYLFGLVYVAPGATLTINPGVTVYGSQSTIIGTTNTVGGLGVFDTVNVERNKGTLCIQRGAKINAAGTAAQPILWTSDDKISAGSRKSGDWGGLVIYGAATFHNAAGNTTTTRFEAFNGVPSRPENFYGGNNDGDNSGVLTYNRLEFGGGVVTAVNAEVNGLTLCAVGNGTTIRYIEVLKSGDDAIEWFGGAVNCDHLFTFATKDDDFDMDEGYHGNLQFLVGFRDTSADNSGSHLIEIDNDALPSSSNNFQPYTAPIISNATLIGPTTRKDLATGGGGTTASFFEGAILSRRRASLRLINSYIIANAMPYGLQYTPTTGCGTGVGPIAALLDPPSTTTPGNVQAWNTFSINNPSFASIAVQSPIEGNGAGIFSSGALLPNDNCLLNKIVSSANFNAGLNTQADYNLGAGFANTAATPGYNTGLVLSAPFTSTNERGGVISTDDWLLNNFGAGKLVSITIQ